MLWLFLYSILLPIILGVWVCSSYNYFILDIFWQCVTLVLIPWEQREALSSKNTRRWSGAAFYKTIITSFKSVSCMGWCKGFNFVFYAFPQLITDEDCKVSGVYDFRSAEIKEDCSLDYSDCIKNEGKFAAYFSLALCCLCVRHFWCYYNIFYWNICFPYHRLWHIRACSWRWRCDWLESWVCWGQWLHLMSLCANDNQCNE